MHIPTSSTLSRGVWRQTCHPLSFHPWLHLSQPHLTILLDYMEPHAMYCYMEADKCGVRGVMRVAHIDMRNTPSNCSAPLTQYQLIWGRECVGLPTLQYCQVILSLPSPTCVWEGCCVHFQWAVCMHALDPSHYTWPSVHNTILGTSWHSTN